MTEEDVINQAIADFDSIEAAMKRKGIDVPKGTDTKEYGCLIDQMKTYDEGYGVGWNDSVDNSMDERLKAIARGNDFHVCAFAGASWTDSNFNPKQDIIITQSTRLFAYAQITDVAAILRRNGVRLDTSKATVLGYLTYESNVTTLPEISLMSCKSANYLVANSYSLQTIERLIVSEDTTFTNAFQTCSKLTHIIFDGVIAKNGLNLQSSKNLDKESLLSLLNSLKDYSTDTSGTTWKITIGDANIAKLTEEELAIADAKGWDVV